MLTDVHALILGSGTSAGVPVIGCSCDVCTSDDPRDARLRTSMALRFTDSTGSPRVILIDTSPDLRQQALTHDITRCDGILYTHNHVDHTFGLDEVRRFNVVMNQAIDVYAEPHTMEHLFRVYRHIFEQEKNVNASFVATLLPQPLDVGTPVDLFGVRCLPIRFHHGRLPIVGFRIEAINADGTVCDEQPGPFPLAYCTDVSSVPPETWPALAGVRVLVLDMLRHRHHPTHLNLDQAVEIAERVGAEQTWFIHMTHDIHHATTQASLPAGMALAYDGLEIRDSSGPAAPVKADSV
ncbi:MAG: MBL fold metallo-hydrolase [Planctomycetota bacterium]